MTMPDRLKPASVVRGWRGPPVVPRRVLLTGRDLDIFQWLVHWRYGSTAQILTVGDFPTPHAGHQRLNQLYQAGWVTSLRLRWPGPSTTAVWAITPSGLAALADQDAQGGWEEVVSVVERAANRHSIAHELGRNAIVLAAEQHARAVGLDLVGIPDTDATIRAPIPGAASWLSITPDAVLDVRGQPWHLEYERSWRRDTLTHKLHSFSLLLHHNLWRTRWLRAPKLLLVPEEAQSQGYRLETWIHEVDAVRDAAVVVVPAAAIRDGTWTAWSWLESGDRDPTPRSWWDLALRVDPIRGPVLPRR